MVCLYYWVFQSGCMIKYHKLEETYKKLVQLWLIIERESSGLLSVSGAWSIFSKLLKSKFRWLKQKSILLIRIVNSLLVIIIQDNCSWKLYKWESTVMIFHIPNQYLPCCIYLIKHPYVRSSATTNLFCFILFYGDKR